MTAKRKTNRLIREKSPYLLQHAHNPVDWYPWGPEAFERARAEDKPVLLSIGYSTCHWCHVMERESFSNPDIAAIMNANFICIKVDREERPDIDNIYMSAVVAMAGRGGWPLTVFLTPDQKPFFGGTYFPPEDRWGISGLRTLLLWVAEAWRARRSEITRAGERLTQALSARAEAGGDSTSAGEGNGLDEGTLSAAYTHFQATFDEHRAGFGHAPKFPMGHNLSFLLRYAWREKQSDALAMAERTLQAMADGGVYDRLGGGFHRYSTDEGWRIPHFEKMLYDQAILAKAYLEAYQATGNERYAGVARETLEYVLRDMTAASGGFYSAEDADSPVPGNGGGKKEGAFYLWTRKEILGALEEEAGQIAIYHFGVRPEGNSIMDPHGEFQGKNVLYAAHTSDETAQHFNTSPEQVLALLEDARRDLFEARAKRPRPHIDDKILTDWNGLMISSLAAASGILGDPKYRDAAERSARFIMANLKDDRGHLLHRHRDGVSGIPGTLEDYAFFIHGLIDLYEATFEAEYLVEAYRLALLMRDLFWDEEAGGFFFTAVGSEELILRTKEVYDGAIPSGNSVAALDLLRLGRLTARPEFEALAAELMRGFSAKVAGMPGSHSFMLMSLDFALGPHREIIIAEGDDGIASEMLHAIYTRFLPGKVLVKRPVSEEEAGVLLNLAPFLTQHCPIGGKTAAYVCTDYACRAPVTSVEDLEALL